MLGDDALEHGPCVVVKRARRRSHRRVVEDLRVRPLQLPGAEERRPIDVGRELGQVVPLEGCTPSCEGATGT